MNEEFVRKDLYESEKRRSEERLDSAVSRFEAKADRTVERLELKMDAYMARVDGTLAKMDGRLDAMDAKINNVSRNVALIMTIFGLIISGISIYFSMPH
ncbi:MAG: hypothetical protein IJG65_09165 [Synergistaceae bacterium]|nr:hypothetical protein [Synergistaceae bacterium]